MANLNIYFGKHGIVAAPTIRRIEFSDICEAMAKGGGRSNGVYNRAIHVKKQGSRSGRLSRTPMRSRLRRSETCSSSGLIA
jgi:hypothetical protein